jgi:hypothetical protein
MTKETAIDAKEKVLDILNDNPELLERIYLEITEEPCEDAIRLECETCIPSECKISRIQELKDAITAIRST